MVQESNIWTVESSRALGAALRALRNQRGLTQEELARALKTTRQRISRMEQGEFSDQVQSLFRELKVLGAVMRTGAVVAGPGSVGLRGTGRRGNGGAESSCAVVFSSRGNRSVRSRLAHPDRRGTVDHGDIAAGQDRRGPGGSPSRGRGSGEAG